MVINFAKTHPKAVMPRKSHLQDAGFDLYAATLVRASYGQIIYDTHICVDIPPGYVGLVFMRSSVCKKGFVLQNAVGVIDSGYSGSIKCVFTITMESNYKQYEIGERIAQLIIMPLPAVTFVEVEDPSDFLHTSERGAGGHGSTGK